MKEYNSWVVTLLIVAVALLAFNSYQLSELKSPAAPVSGGTVAAAATSGSSAILPKGVPKVYGEELKFSYDDIDPANPQRANAAIAKLSKLDQELTLEGDVLQRYIKILYTDHGGIACEYCCGARSVIFQNGEAACGCAHSYAMRGLTKYLLLNHPDMTDEEILAEAGKLKVLFFPTIHEAKAAAMEQKGIAVNYVSLATNENRGIEKGQSKGQMVGGC